MANHNKVGTLGERLAKNYLQEQHYQILETNWRWGKAEIDLIVRLDNLIVFVEVKTRTRTTFGLPEEAITAQKQERLYGAATEYLYQQKHEGEFRFDVVSIILEPQVSIQHFPDAFFPDWT